MPPPCPPRGSPCHPHPHLHPTTHRPCRPHAAPMLAPCNRLPSCLSPSSRENSGTLLPLFLVAQASNRLECTKTRLECYDPPVRGYKFLLVDGIPEMRVQRLVSGWV